MTQIVEENEARGVVMIKLSYMFQSELYHSDFSSTALPKRLSVYLSPEQAGIMTN